MRQAAAEAAAREAKIKREIMIEIISQEVGPIHMQRFGLGGPIPLQTITRANQRPVSRPCNGRRPVDERMAAVRPQDWIGAAWDQVPADARAHFELLVNARQARSWPRQYVARSGSRAIRAMSSPPRMQLRRIARQKNGHVP